MHFCPYVKMKEITLFAKITLAFILKIKDYGD